MMVWKNQRDARVRELAAYLDQELGKTDAQRVSSLLDACPDAQLELQQLRQIRDGLAAVDPELERLDLAAVVRAKWSQARAVKAQPAPWRGARSWVAAAVLVTMCLAVGNTVRPARQPASEFRSKAASAAFATHDDQATARIYIVRDQVPSELPATMSRSDGLMFSYTNQLQTPYSHLMIFAVDASAAVRWFHPAFLLADTDPTSIRIEHQNSDVLLPEIIVHDFALGSLSLNALFTTAPLRVSEVESWLKGEHASLKALPWKNATLQTWTVEVVP